MQSNEGAMPGATPRRGDAGTRSALAAVGRLNPEWQPWLELVDLALIEVDDPVWAEAHVEPAPDRSPTAPLLHGAVVSVDVRAAHRWTRELLNVAASHLVPDRARRRHFDARRTDALALLEAAATHDRQRIEALAEEADVDAVALYAVAQLAARPLLLSCGNQLADRVPGDWAEGHCPVCGAWPTIAELRGLKRTRHLRCGCCGGDWTFSVLHCPFCNEKEHTNLGGLVVDGEEETRRVETCHTCRGYVKTIATLVAVPPRRIAIADLETVDLELAALERGYHRPDGPGAKIDLQVVPAPTGASKLRIPSGFFTGRWRTP